MNKTGQHLLLDIITLTQVQGASYLYRYLHLALELTIYNSV